MTRSVKAGPGCIPPAVAPQQKDHIQRRQSGEKVLHVHQHCKDHPSQQGPPMLEQADGPQQQTCNMTRATSAQESGLRSDDAAVPL